MSEGLTFCCKRGRQKLLTELTKAVNIGQSLYQFMLHIMCPCKNSDENWSPSINFLFDVDIFSGLRTSCCHVLALPGRGQRHATVRTRCCGPLTTCLGRNIFHHKGTRATLQHGVVVFLHGWASSRFSWPLMAELLSLVGHPCPCMPTP